MTRKLFRLTELDRELLVKHYDFYCSLASGARQPTTDAQRHFVAVCRGQAEVVTNHERAYLAFKKLVLLSRMTEKQVIEYRFSLEVPIGEEAPEPERPEQVASVPTQSTSGLTGGRSTSLAKVFLARGGFLTKAGEECGRVTALTQAIDD